MRISDWSSDVCSSDLGHDTMVAGAGLNNIETVKFVVSNAPAAIERLAELGVPFNAGEDFAERWHLTREGGHSHRRLVPVDDATGAAVPPALPRAAAGTPNITQMPDMVAIDKNGRGAWEEEVWQKGRV